MKRSGPGVLEKWDFGLLRIFFLTVKLLAFKNDKLPFKTNLAKDGIFDIPLFHVCGKNTKPQ